MRLLKRIAAMAVVSASFMTVVGQAHAGPTQGGQKKPAPQDEAAARGQVLFEQSEAAYREGRFDEAITLLKEAFRYTPDPVVFYNLARAYQAKGDLREAEANYESYLAQAKDIPDRADIEAKLASVKAQLQAEEDKKKPPPVVGAPVVAPVTAPAEESGSSPSVIPWIISGVGGGGMIAGAVLGGLALSKNSDAEAAPSLAETADLRSSAETMALVSTISLAVGGAVLAGGAIWGIVDITTSGPDTPDAAKTSLRVHVGPSNANLTLTF